jgi:hypothetical protein
VTGDGALARRFARGETDRAESAALVRALLREEPPTGATLGPAPQPGPGAYASVLAAAEQRAALLADGDAGEQRRAAELLVELDALDGEQARLAAIESDLRFQSWALAGLLGERSLAAGTENPERCRELARLAVTVADREPAGPESAALRSDLRALAWAQRGNAERIAGELRAAEAAIREAEKLLDSGTGDPLLRARILSLLASLRSDQSRFAEAVGLADQAARLYRRGGDLHGCGRTLIKLASFHAYRDELDLACAQLDRALASLDPALEPRLLFAAHHNRASYRERAGRLAEAAAELALAEPLARATLDRVRLAWLAGRIALRRGDAAAGERSLLQARADFLAHGLAYETAQVSLELAALYAELGRTADQRRLAEEMVPLFAARDVHPEARAALLLFCDAARREAATASLAQEVAEYLDRAHGRPRLAFRNTSG